MKIRWFTLPIVLALSVTLTGCNQNLVLEQEDLELAVGESHTLAVQGIESAELVWDSSDLSVAAVDQQGQVNAVNPGSAVITVKAGKRRAACNVVVVNPPSSGFNITPSVLWVGVGDTRVLDVPSTLGEVIWESEDIDIAEVDQSGSLTGISPGEITVTAVIAGVRASCQVTVMGTIPHSMVLGIGETRQVEFCPAQDGVLWKSGDTTIATVDQSGNVTGVAMGNTYVSAVADSKEVACSVTVGKDISSQRTAVVSGLISRVESFSPDGGMFVSIDDRVMAGSVKRIMDLEGSAYELPYSPINHEEANYGSVSWRGTKLVYSVTGWGPGAAIYVYDWKDHTTVNIAEEFNWDDLDTPSAQPIFSSEDVVLMLQPDGLWSYDLNKKRWNQKMLQLPEVRGRETWSPDLSKVAWVEYDADESKLVVLDVQSGQLQTIFKSQSFAGFAWAEDSTLLVVLEYEHETEEAHKIYYPLTVLSVDGEVLKSFTDPGNTFQGNALNTELTWVPGQDKVAYNTEDGVAIRDLVDGRRWLIAPPAIPPEMAAQVQKEFRGASLILGHTWLKNGDLAISHSYLYHGPSYGVMEIYSFDWADWSNGE